MLDRPGRQLSGAARPPACANDDEDARDQVGVFGRTYEMARDVVEAATAEPDRFGVHVDEMDRTGKVTCQNGRADPRLGYHRIGRNLSRHPMLPRSRSGEAAR
jgi:hypothetical protein